MRRAAIARSALLLFIGVAVFISGCGGELGSARAYVKKGDETIAAIEQKSRTLGTSMAKTFNDLYNDVSAGKTPSAATFDSTEREIKSTADGMLADAAEAGRQFAKIRDLNGVPYYREYADLESKVIDADVKGLKELKTFLDEAQKKLSAAPFDPVGFQLFVNQFSSGLQKTGEETGRLQRRADELKRQRKL